MLEEEDKEPFADFELTDFDYIVSALGYANAEGLTLEDIMPTVLECEDGQQFDAGVCALINLRGIR